MKNMWLLITACLAFFFCATPINERLLAAPGDAIVTPGELFVEHPTLINLGFEWRIDGDANRNASVEVSFRKQGETAWRKGMPLLRIQNERIYQPNRVVVCYDPASPPLKLPPFARDKPLVDSRPTAYVCHRSACSPPVSDWQGLRRLIVGRP